VNDATLNKLKSWIGRSITLHSDLPVFSAQALAGAINHTEAPDTGNPLPLPWHWLYFLDPTQRDSTGEDGHPRKGGFLPPVPLPRRMWAAGALEIAQPLVLGLATEKVSSITSVEAKNGRSGPLVFVNVKHELRQRGDLCIIEEQNLVYREAPRERTELPPGEKAQQKAGILPGDDTRPCTAVSLLGAHVQLASYSLRPGIRGKCRAIPGTGGAWASAGHVAA